MTANQAIIEAEVFRYVTDREVYNQLDNDLRIRSVLRRLDGAARSGLRQLWNSANADYPPTVYGPNARLDVEILGITQIGLNRATVRLRKRLTSINGTQTGLFTATLLFEFRPRPAAPSTRSGPTLSGSPCSNTPSAPTDWRIKPCLVFACSFSGLPSSRASLSPKPSRVAARMTAACGWPPIRRVRSTASVYRYHVTTVEFGEGESIRSIIAGDTEGFGIDGVPGGQAFAGSTPSRAASTPM